MSFKLGGVAAVVAGLLSLYPSPELGPGLGNYV